MGKQNLYLIIGILAGVLIGIFSVQYAIRSRNAKMMDMMGMGNVMSKSECPMMSSGDGMHGTDMSMNQMAGVLETLKGDDFNQMFIKLMIDHHQGAIDMANLALKNSDRKELRDLADNIISAQTKEIRTMEEWLVDWYK